MREKPPPALFEEIFIERSSPLNLRDFRILKRVYDRSRRSMIPPDVAICEECSREIKDSIDTTGTAVHGVDPGSQ